MYQLPKTDEDERMLALCKQSRHFASSDERKKASQMLDRWLKHVIKTNKCNIHANSRKKLSIKIILDIPTWYRLMDNSYVDDYLPPAYNMFAETLFTPVHKYYKGYK